MLKYICYLLIFMGVCLISYQYGTEKTIKPIKKIDDDDDINKFSSLDPKNYIIDRQFDRMFIDTSVWNNYDTSTINKIYKYKDLDKISDTLSV